MQHLLKPQLGEAHRYLHPILLAEASHVAEPNTSGLGTVLCPL